MRKYELMAIFPVDEEKAKTGAELVRSDLAKFGAEIEKEDPFGDRDFAYEIKKQNRGRYILFTVNVNPAKLEEIDGQFHLNVNLIRYLFVKLDEKKAQ